jgi:hypothetical protein
MVWGCNSGFLSKRIGGFILTQRKTFPPPPTTLSTTNPTCTGLGSSPALRSEKSAADHLKRGTAAYVYRDLAFDVDILLKWIAEKLFVRLLTHFNLFRIGSSSTLL